MKFPIVISFQKSTSKNLREVLKTARNFYNLEEEDTYTINLSVDELFERWDDFNHIFHTVKQWKGTTIEHFGKTITQQKEMGKWFYAIQDIYYCYFRYYRASYFKKDFCNDGGCWGCKQLKSVERNISPAFFTLPNYWYSYGHFLDNFVWEIDKHQIRATLLDEARKKWLDACPCFHESMVEPYINGLPDTILVDGQNWTVEYKLDFLANGPLRIPSSIRHNYPENFEDIPVSEVIVKRKKETPDEEANRLIEEYKKRRNGRITA